MDITMLPSAAELSERRRLQIAQAQEMLKEHVSLKNNQLAAFSNEQLLSELFVRSINEGEAGRADESSDDADVASDQQLKDVAAAAAEKEKKSTANDNNELPREQDNDEDAAKRKSKKSNRSSGGFISMMIAFGSIMTLILSLSLINQSGGLGQGGAPPTLPPFGSRSLRHRSNNDNDESPETIQSPLPASIVVPVPPPPPIFSSAAVSNRRMKFDKLRFATCFDTPNWVDMYGYGCDVYEEYDGCSGADWYAGDMGPATSNCCICGGGSVSLPPTNSPTISDSPTKSKSATPSTSPTITNSPTKSATPSTSLSNSPSIFPTRSFNPSVTCFDTPNWKDKYGDGCVWYEANDQPGCPIYGGELNANDMGPATDHCCFCAGGSASLPPANSPYPSNSPTKSATPSSSSKPSSSPSISTNPTQFCLDTPNWEDNSGSGCDVYGFSVEPGCPSTNSLAGNMGPATENCCHCQGGIHTCEDFRSKCQDYSNVGALERKDGVMSPLCNEAESFCCGDQDHDVEITTTDWGHKYTVGLYNECKCDFWSRLCEDAGVGEACDYAAEYCCGENENDESDWEFFYLNSPTCYCDFYNYAQRKFDHALKPKAMNISKEFTSPCHYFESRWVDWTGLDFERTSLEAIFNKANGQNWTKNDGWMDETLDHCQWYGISCGDDGRITRVDLRDNNLAGQFPVYTRNYTYSWGDPALESDWKVTKYGLANLYKLETIDLAGNKLTGTIDHRPLYNLALLKHFDVSGNQLSGEVDALITPSITHSDFSNNNFTSVRRFEKYKGSYQKLSYCDMSNNAIQINAADRLDSFPPNMKQFFAQNNQIYGSLPDSTNNLPQLQQFNMSHNSLSGSLPESLNNLPQLRQIDMSSNALSGQLPDFAESFLSLEELDMSNQTIGFTGSIPEDLGRFQSLKVLNIANNKLTGTIPSSIGNIAVLEIFNVSNNLLSSTIPAELGLLEDVLKRLDLSNNTLSGRIPSQIGQLQDASILLGGNLFYNSSEAAPLSLCMLSNVEVFDLANDTTLCPIERNALSDLYDLAKGVEWTNSTNWMDEYASYCIWHGVICDDNTNQVTKLKLSNNGLSGRLSEGIGNLTSIEELDLSDNDIKGSIPTEIGRLSKLTYLRLSYNAFTGTIPEGLGELTELKLLQLHSNRITGIPNTTRLDDSVYGNSSFVSDCGVPSAFEEPLVCENCTMCCNANEDCYPQQKTRVVKMGLNYATFAAVLFAAFVIFCSLVALFLYLYRKRKNRENAQTTSTQRDNKYAMGRIGKESVYSYIITDMRLGWLGAFGTLAIQFGILILFVLVSEANLQDDRIDIEFTWKCPRNSYLCRDTADLTRSGWFIFCMLMIAFLAKDMINGCKLIYFSSKIRHSTGSKIRYFIGGTGLCSITLFALYVSTVYNSAIATSNTDIVANSVVVLFVMEIDEYIFAALDAINEKLTKHASDSVDEEEEAEKEGEIEEMKEELALQKTQIATQQEELMLQKDQMARQNDEIAVLRDTVQKMEDSLAAVALESIPQSIPNESVRAITAASGDTSLARDAEKDGSVNEVEDLNELQEDETAFQMKEQVTGSSRLEHPVMQSDFEDSQVQGGEDADTSDSENAAECEDDKEAEL